MPIKSLQSEYRCDPNLLAGSRKAPYRSSLHALRVMCQGEGSWTHLGSARISILSPLRSSTTMSPQYPRPRPMEITDLTSEYAASSCSSAGQQQRPGQLRLLMMQQITCLARCQCHCMMSQ